MPPGSPTPAVMRAAPTGVYVPYHALRCSGGLPEIRPIVRQAGVTSLNLLGCRRSSPFTFSFHLFGTAVEEFLSAVLIQTERPGSPRRMGITKRTERGLRPQSARLLLRYHSHFQFQGQFTFSLLLSAAMGEHPRVSHQLRRVGWKSGNQALRQSSDLVPLTQYLQHNRSPQSKRFSATERWVRVQNTLIMAIAVNHRGGAEKSLRTCRCSGEKRLRPQPVTQNLF